MENRYTFAKALIRQAGDFIKQRMVTDFDVMVKGRLDDIVTSIDIAVQELMSEAILAQYPNDQILAEENNAHASLMTGARWVIDPIDGTLNFVTQQSDFAVMLSYIEDGVGQFGLIYDVMADKLYSGGGEIPVTCNDKPLASFNNRDLTKSLVACNTGMLLRNSHGLQEVLRDSLGVRNYGCAGLSMAKVLDNQLWAYFSCVYPWDYMAGAILGEALGYRLVTLTGETPDFQTRQEVMFLPQIAVSEMVRRLAEATN